jgi:hypothetical protein
VSIASDSRTILTAHGRASLLMLAHVILHDCDKMLGARPKRLARSFTRKSIEIHAGTIRTYAAGLAETVNTPIGTDVNLAWHWTQLRVAVHYAQITLLSMRGELASKGATP